LHAHEVRLASGASLSWLTRELARWNGEIAAQQIQEEKNIAKLGLTPFRPPIGSIRVLIQFDRVLIRGQFDSRPF